MFSSGPNYTKLKTNLRLALNRLKLLEKKKAELAQKARKEIADYLATGKTERARIRVEHIIREDYLVEAMEIIEMYCDLVLARFGLITQMKELDDGIAEAVSSLVWVCPRLQSDVAELKVISDIFITKYGPQFAEHSRTATGEHHVSGKLMNKLQLQAPPKLLVEKYLIEIAKNYNIEYEPDPQVMQDETPNGAEVQAHLIDLSDRNNLGGGGAVGPPPQMGFIGYPSLPPLPDPPAAKPFNYPPPYGQGSEAGGANGGHPQHPFSYNIPPTQSSYEQKDLNTSFINRPKPYDDPPPRYTSINPVNMQDKNKPKPQPRQKLPPPGPSAPPATSDIPNLPNVPQEMPDMTSDENKPNNTDNDDIDFDDLSRRFENLKKRK
ncbi:IST1 homolog isoform X3 [Bactrocera neohumeralis]|uniref:IST1 homolog isoform X3 n=1 Tax=Bactrocera tryoni TaxID=59916 RepID=UPI001A985CAD|nr:IST1 homolog isoform X3 [Bactrocera tryoni]XP_050334550.1 IST1 homolog isoform X3 [Bactrocera neohumeralis]